jgi:glycosyltransferase involved in cell wall biosynthesis
MTIRVLHILNELKPSGAEVMLAAAAGHWREYGVHPEILSTGAQVGVFSTNLRQSGYDVLHIPFKKYSLRFCLKLNAAVEKFDVIHLHTENGNFMIGLICRLSGKRVIRTIHNAFDYKGLMRIIRCVQRRILSILGVLHVSIGATVQTVEHQVLRNKTYLVPNWYDADKYEIVDPLSRGNSRKFFGIEDDAIVIAVVGNCSDIKNHSALYIAVSEMRQKNVRILHVGSGGCEEDEKDQCHDLGLSNSVSFLGRLDSPLRVLQAADLFAMPSLKEGFSIAALEAIGVGLPCAFSDVHGLRDLKTFFEKSCGWGEADSEGLRFVLETMIQNLAAYKIAARQNAVKCRDQFGVDAGIRRYTALYKGEVQRWAL